MKKCLKIMISVETVPSNFLKTVVQKHATAHKVEGTVQFVDDVTIKIIACGTKDMVDTFLDVLHKETAKIVSDMLHVEPFIKERDYRGVFRVIE